MLISKTTHGVKGQRYSRCPFFVEYGPGLWNEIEADSMSRESFFVGWAKILRERE
jgi:hypothetical protein